MRYLNITLQVSTATLISVSLLFQPLALHCQRLILLDLGLQLFFLASDLFCEFLHFLLECSLIAHISTLILLDLLTFLPHLFIQPNQLSPFSLRLLQLTAQPSYFIFTQEFPCLNLIVPSLFEVRDNILKVAQFLCLRIITLFELAY